jgi:hypothetical protein
VGSGNAALIIARASIGFGLYLGSVPTTGKCPGLRRNFLTEGGISGGAESEELGRRATES